MKSIILHAGILLYVAVVITIAMRFSPPAIHTRTVQTIAINPGDAFERHLQHDN